MKEHSALMMILCFSLYENTFKKKPLPSLSSRKGLTNWRFLLKNNKALCASYFNFQSSIFNSIDYNAPADAQLHNKCKKYQPNNFEHCSKPPPSKLVSPSLLGFLSPGNGGIERGVKTIEDGRGSVFLLF